MSIMPLPKDHPKVKPKKVGVIIANLGTPDATDYWSMRRYLNEFLSDKRVVDLPNWKWQPILQGIILTFRPKKSGEAYASIWDNENDESPLLGITRKQSIALSERFKKTHGDNVIVDFAMRYGNPSADSVIQKMHDQGCDRIVFFPLYPQYAAPTTATANDQAFRSLMKMNWQPAFRTVPAYFENDHYLDALAASLKEGIAASKVKPTKLVLSYHGVPLRYLMEGDPYHCQCHKTSRLVAERAGFDADFIETAFQSKFGREEWVGPATVDFVAELAKAGHKSIAIAAPAFSSDCVETLEEIQEEIFESFEHAGGEHFNYIPCLNDRSDHIEALAKILENELAGWVDNQ